LLLCTSQLQVEHSACEGAEKRHVVLRMWVGKVGDRSNLIMSPWIACSVALNPQLLYRVVIVSFCFPACAVYPESIWDSPVPGKVAYIGDGASCIELPLCAACRDSVCLPACFSDKRVSDVSSVLPTHMWFCRACSREDGTMNVYPGWNKILLYDLLKWCHRTSSSSRSFQIGVDLRR
jgi:hypothetical protein